MRRTVPRAGDAAVVIVEAVFNRLQAPGSPATLKDPIASLDLEGVEFERDRTPARDIEP